MQNSIAFQNIPFSYISAKFYFRGSPVDPYNYRVNNFENVILLSKYQISVNRLNKLK